MSLTTTCAFDPGASHLSTILDRTSTHVGHTAVDSLATCTPSGSGCSAVVDITRRQLQITTTITPTITRGATQAGVPTRTDPRQRPGASAAAASSAESDNSLFPANLSWWQILGIAIAGIVLFGIVAYIFVSRRNKAKLAAIKAKEAEVEEGRKAKDLDDVPRGMGMGMGGMGMGGMGMGIGMGGMPMLWGGQNQHDRGGGGGGGRGKRTKKRYDSDDSGSECYDSTSSNGTIWRKRRPKGRKERRKGGKRKDDYSSDETLSSAASSSHYARPTKGRGRNDKDNKRYRDRKRQESSRVPNSRGDDYPLGLGPPTTGLHTGSSRSLSKKESLGKRFRDSVFSTFDSMTNKAAKLEALRNKAIEATRIEQKLKLQDDLRREEELEKQRQAKVREANEKIRVEKLKEEKARQDMIPMYSTPLPPRRKETYGSSPTPLIPPVARSRSNDSHQHSPNRQPTKSNHVGRQQRLRENLAPASAYNSALPDFQVQKPKSQSSKRSSSDLPYAYDGVASVISSQPPPVADTRRPPELEGRRKPSRKAKPPMHRQDSDQPLKSAMRAPGDRKPKRKATITEKPPTTRMITDPRVYESDSQSDWLPRQPVTSKSRAPRQGSDLNASSRCESVHLIVPHPSQRPTIEKGGLAPAPQSRAKTKSRLDSTVRRPVERQETSSGAAGVGAGATRGGGGSGDQQGWGQWLGWKASGGMGNVDVTLPSQSKALDPAPPRRQDNPTPVQRPSVDRAPSSSMSDPHQPGKRWANRLRERK